MRLVIVGEFDSDNVGDQLIGEGQATLFSGCGCDIRVLSLESSRSLATAGARIQKRNSSMRTLHRALYQRSTLYRHSIESVGQILRKSAYEVRVGEILEGADALIIGGGQLLSDGTLRMLHRLDQITEAAHRSGIPIAIFGTGMSPAKSFLSRRALRRILGRVSGCSRFRDSASMKVAVSVRSDIALPESPTPDCAIAGIAHRRALSPELGLVGVAPMAPRILARIGFQSDDIDSWWIEIIKSLLEHGAKPVLFSTGVIADSQYAATLQEKMDELGVSVDLLPRPRSSDELLSLLGGMDRILAQRLHASISFYAMGGVPASASWDTKVGEFYRRIQLNGRVFQAGAGDPANIVRSLVDSAEPGVSRMEIVRQSKADAADCVNELMHLRRS